MLSARGKKETWSLGRTGYGMLHGECTQNTAHTSGQGGETTHPAHTCTNGPYASAPWCASRPPTPGSHAPAGFVVLWGGVCVRDKKRRPAEQPPPFPHGRTSIPWSATIAKCDFWSPSPSRPYSPRPQVKSCMVGVGGVRELPMGGGNGWEQTSGFPPPPPFNTYTDRDTETRRPVRSYLPRLRHHAGVPPPAAHGDRRPHGAAPAAARAHDRRLLLLVAVNMHSPLSLLAWRCNCPRKRERHTAQAPPTHSTHQSAGDGGLHLLRPVLVVRELVCGIHPAKETSVMGPNNRRERQGSPYATPKNTSHPHTHTFTHANQPRTRRHLVAQHAVLLPSPRVHLAAGRDDGGVEAPTRQLGCVGWLVCLVGADDASGHVVS